MPSDVDLSIVMPAHNEEELLSGAVHRVVEGLRAAGRRFEVLVVENGSIDKTAIIADRLEEELAEVRSLRYPGADYGRSLRAGFLAAGGATIVNFDVDYVDLGFLETATAIVEAPGGPALVVGSKRSAGATDNRSLPRRIVTWTFSTLLKVAFGLKVSDTHGMKALRREPLVPVVAACRLGTDLFDTEMVLRAERAGLGAAEVPVTVEELRPSRSPIAKRIPRTLTGLVRLRLVLWLDRH